MVQEVFSGKAEFGIQFQHSMAAEHVLRIPMVDDLINKLTDARSDLSWTTVVTELVFFAMHLMEGGLTIRNLMLSAAHLLYRVGKPAMISIFERLSNKMRTQSADALRVMAMAIAGSVSVLCVLLFSRLPKDANLDQFINRFSRLGACMKSAEQVHSVAEMAVGGFMNLVKTEVLGMSSDDLKEFAEIDRFCDEVMKENTTNISARCQADTGALRQKVNTWLQQADVIRMRLDAARVPQIKTTRFQSVSLFLFKLRDMLDSTAPGLCQARVAPLLIHIHGTTGVGKSSCLDYLNTRLLVALGSTDPNDLHNKVYYRHPGKEFFDGFNNGTEIVVCDDFGSLADNAVRPSPEPLEAIQMTNTAPYKPPKADLTGKATAQFEAKVVIWTSNRVDFKFPSLTNPEAIANRVQLRFKQYVHPDFAVERNIGGTMMTTLDSAKVAEAAKTNPNAWRDCMLFDMEDTDGVPLLERQSYRPLKEKMTFEEFAQVCVDSLLKKQGVGSHMRKEREAYYETCLKGEAETILEGSPFPKDLIDINTIELALLEDEKKLKVDFKPLPLFESPGFLGRCVGKHAHLNVFRFIADNGLHGEWIPYTEEEAPNGELEEIEKFMATRCFSMPAGQLDRVSKLIYRTWRAIFRHEPTPLVHFQELQELKNFCFECKCHDDPEALETVVMRCRRAAAECMKSGLMQAARHQILFSRRHPIAGLILNLCVNVLVLYALKKLFEWVFTKLWTFGAAVTSSVTSAAGWTPVEVDSEAYAAAAVKATQVVRTELYPTGGVKAVPVVKTEVYPSGSVRATQVVRTELGGDDELGGDAESVTDQNAAEIRRKVALNMYHLLTRGSEDEPWYGAGSLTVVKGRFAITNRHVYHALKDQVLLRATVGRVLEYRMLKSDLNMISVADTHEVYGQRDVCGIELPKNVHCHGNIIPLFMSGDDFSRHVEPSRVCLVKYTRMLDKSVLMFQETDKARAYDRASFDLDLGEASVRVRMFYCYAMETQGGDCGGVLVAFDPRFNRKICGIHMAGGVMGQGYTAAAAAVSQEFINHMASEIQWRHVSSFFDGEVLVDNPAQAEAGEDGVISFGPSQDGLVLCGTANTRVHSASTTTISPSPVHDICGPVLKRPAYLARGQNAQGVDIDPLALAMQKVKTPSLLIEKTALSIAAKHVSDMINGIPHEQDARTLTFNEAIQGIVGDERYPAINRSTSPGYGWAKKGRGKTFYLGTDKFVVRQEVFEEYTRVLANLRKGQRTGLYWTDTLKDELRPLEKVEAGKTRLFSAGEMVLTILLRQFFMGFNAHMARNAVVVESCVGVNAYSMDWTAVAVKLQKFGPNVVAGDFTNYDGTLPADGLWAVLDVINEFYGDCEDNKIRALLWLDIVNSVHIQGRTVYQWTHSQPSGCPFTSVLNSVFHSMLVRIAYLLSARKYCPEKATLSHFNKMVSHVNYGDDDVTNVSVEADWFNSITMAEAYATFGMTYTDETKSGELVKFRRLDEIQFLKRSFVWDPHQARYRAPLDINTIREMPCWNKQKGDKYALTAEVLEDAVYELAQHPRAVFDKEIVQMENARRIVAQRVPTLSLPTFEEVDFIDTCRYTIPGVVSTKALKLSDRGTTILAENCRAANPASVCQHPLAGYADAEGGVFTPTDGCVPSINNRLSILPTQLATESLSRWLNRLAISPRRQLYNSLTEEQRRDYRTYYLAQSDRPTICQDSCIYKHPDDQASYVMVKDCNGCDFHSRNHDKERTIFDRWCFQEGLIADETDLRGQAQSGRSSEDEIYGDTYSGDAAKMEFLWEALGAMEAVNARLLTRANLAVQSISIGLRPEFTLVWLRDERTRIRELRKELNLWMQANRSTYGGVAQAGEEPTGVDSNPNFAGGEVHETQHEVMTFHQDGDVAEAERHLDAPIPLPIRAGAEDKLANDLKDFLRRPIHLYDFVWPRTAPRGTELLRVNFPREFLVNQMVQEKLAGFRFSRFTLVVELQINAQPMNAGGVIAWFEPLVRQLAYRPSSSGHLGGIYGYPNVVYRLGDATSVQIKIPFFPLVSHYDLTTGYGGAGDMIVTTLSPLTGSDDVDATVFVWAEDIETSMPTGMPLLFRGQAQAGPADERKRPGNIETIARSVGSAAGSLTKVPVIGAFASVAETVLGGVGAIASAFGWSKPLDPEFPTEVGPMLGRNMANFNGDSKAKVLALDARNTTNIPTAVFNTTEDEMSFNYLAQRPIFTDAFKVLGSQAQGTLVYKWPVEPSACKKSVVVVPGADTVWVARFENYLSYMSTCAKYYRGGIKYCFQFFKTDFHSGRLRFTYVPGARTDTVYSDIDINKCYSQVFDLRSTKDVEFTIPYNYLQPWKETVNLSDPPLTVAKNLEPVYANPQGYIYVTIVNALRNPSTVDSEIEAIMLVSGAPDLQFAVPQAAERLRIISKAADVPAPTLSGRAQSGNFFETTTVEEDVNANSIGEVFTGFRQWLKRFHPMYGTDTNLDRTRPYLVNTFDTAVDLMNDAARRCDAFRRAQELYRFQSGSMRVMVIPNFARHYTASVFTGAAQVTPGYVSTGQPLTATTPLEMLMEYEIPFYQPFPALMTDVGHPTESDPSISGTPHTTMPYNKGTILYLDPAPETFEIMYRSIGESFSYGFLIGVPVTMNDTTIPIVPP